jgi:hypothetical protein
MKIDFITKIKNTWKVAKMYYDFLSVVEVIEGDTLRFKIVNSIHEYWDMSSDGYKYKRIRLEFHYE